MSCALALSWQPCLYQVTIHPDVDAAVKWSTSRTAAQACRDRDAILESIERLAVELRCEPFSPMRVYRPLGMFHSLSLCWPLPGDPVNVTVGSRSATVECTRSPSLSMARCLKFSQHKLTIVMQPASRCSGKVRYFSILTSN